MGKSCCAVGCANRQSKATGIPFYRFPINPEKRRLWIVAVNRKNWEPNKFSWLCGAHFISGAKSDDPASPDYIPSVFNHVLSPLKHKLTDRLVRYERLERIKKKREDVQAVQDRQSAAEALLHLSESQNGISYCEPYSGIAVSTTLAMSDIAQLESQNQDSISEMAQMREEFEQMKEKCNVLIRENAKLKTNNTNLKSEVECLKARLEATQAGLSRVEEQLSAHSFQEGSLRDDDSKVRHYTGLPGFAVLMVLMRFLTETPGVELTSRSALTLFQQIVLVLMTLRLNLGDRDLAYQFGVNQSTVSRYVKKWIDIMYPRLKPLIKWPERDQLLKTMPIDFRKSFKSCVTIIDCFEVFMERPTSLKARAQTWSNYKHHNTVKFLIGIAPQGLITFISKGWGGRVSDVHLTENSGLLEHLNPGDVVLADRGFNIHESASMYYAKVKLPPFTKGKKQLSQEEVDFARELSRVRIHVERVIDVVRQKYTILQSALPVNFIMCSDTADISSIDKVVTICCALCNCCKSVVSFE